MSYKTDTSDERLVAVTNEEKTEIAKSDNMYNDMVADSDSYYQDQIKASKDWANTQKNLQNQKTNLAIKEINQQKDQAKKDYTKEQSGAYVDWQKQSNEYGANAEQMAAQGMTNTGYAESSQVSMYNTYQNRVATARESFNRAILNYDNAIAEARLQNSSILAEIAYESLQKQLELSLAGFQYKNQLIQQKATAARDIRKDYTAEYQAVLDQIYKEDALQADIDQHAATLKQQREIADAQLTEEQRQFDILHPSGETVKGGSGGSGDSGSGSGDSGGSDGGGLDIEKDKGFTGSTYNSAVKYMEKNGVPSSDASNVMTRGEWKTRKQGYDKYSDYLKDYTKYAVSELAK